MSYHVETTLCHDITTYDISWQPYGKLQNERQCLNYVLLTQTLCVHDSCSLLGSKLHAPDTFTLFSLLWFTHTLSTILSMSCCHSHKIPGSLTLFHTASDS